MVKFKYMLSPIKQKVVLGYQNHSLFCLNLIFSLPTAPQILRVERRHLTIHSRYGIITAEKNLCGVEFSIS